MLKSLSGLHQQAGAVPVMKDRPGQARLIVGILRHQLQTSNLHRARAPLMDYQVVQYLVRTKPGLKNQAMPDKYSRFNQSYLGDIFSRKQRRSAMLSTR
jgi:hypothetical protein